MRMFQAVTAPPAFIAIGAGGSNDAGCPMNSAAPLTRRCGRFYAILRLASIPRPLETSACSTFERLHRGAHISMKS